MVIMRNRGMLCRLTAALLCLCMTVSAAGTAFAEDAPVLPGYTKDIMEGTRLADPDTMDDYLNRLLSQENGSRYAGRVWTDKTVFAYEDGNLNKAEGDENKYETKHFDGHHTITLNMATDGYNKGPVEFNADFAHVFSALASSQVVNEYPPSPVDLVIVFDMSGSMGQDTRYGLDRGVNTYVDNKTSGYPDGGVIMSDRIANSRVQKTLDAINETIDGLMEQNPQNRVAVCGYGANAVVLMPLAHYQHGKDSSGEDIPYLSVGGMETLYHPSDLVYKDAAGENPAGWYWMNNRDTCYTVVVNAGNQMSTYTDGPLDEAPVGSWKPVERHVVSNNVLDSDGNRVMAFPGAWKADRVPVNTYADKSKEVYNSAKSGAAGYENGSQNNGGKLIAAIAGTESLEADDYVGYFTNTQGGIYLAYKQLADTTVTTYAERLSNGVMSTVARIPAAIIMSDGGANFAFNEMGNDHADYTVNLWNGRYGEKSKDGTPITKPNDPDSWYKNDNVWDGTSDEKEGRYKDYLHRLGGAEGTQTNLGDEWYNVYLPGNDTLKHSSSDGEWNGLHGIYNIGADFYQDGTLTTPPGWQHAGVLYNSDNELAGTPSAVLEVLLTASYMNQVVKTHYQNGWIAHNASEDSRIELSTYTMNVDTAHVPQWGRWRLFPTLNPRQFSINDVDAWSKDYKHLGENYMVDASSMGEAGELYHERVFANLKEAWANWKEGDIDKNARAGVVNGIRAHIGRIGDDSTYLGYPAGGGKDMIYVTDEQVEENIAYNDQFYDVTSADLSGIFDEILALILGKVFVPVSGDNDAGVGDSITYQDPLGEYMEIKHQSIKATPHHIDGHAHNDGKATTFDMALLLFGEMHGIVRTGIYDFQWNDAWMEAHDGEWIDGEQIVKGTTPFPMGWYAADAGATDDRVAGANELPPYCGSAEEAWAKGYVFRLNNQALTQYVPIVQDEDDPDKLSPQAKNTRYTLYRFAGDEDVRNELRRNPIYGTVPEEIKKQWADEKAATGSYPTDNKIYAKTPGVYRLSDIRVWVEDTGDFVDTTGAFTPDTSYDRSLYLNIPAAAVPTQLATITLGKGGVLSYQTNLPSDYETLMKGKDGYSIDQWENYCYQSTPLRLFYAVGLEDKLIQRDESGKQQGVDITALSEEYVAAHTDPATGNIWFISNYYSNTPFGNYVTDTLDERTRGDPTITFSPSNDNRYYVFQKPLPLYAHAYRVHEEASGTHYLKAVDNQDGKIWKKEDNNKGGNGNTTGSDGTTTIVPVWETTKDEDGNDVQQRPGAWVGGLYMGVYDDVAAFETAYQTAKANGSKTITDSKGVTYPYSDDGIVFLARDLLEHVTSDEDGYAEGSVSFSSDDYFFLLVEYYRPDGGVGVDDKGNKVPGTQGATSVQRVVARQGSEFGSAFNTDKIRNGDMLCWTDVANKLNLEFDYLSRTETGDDTRGEPTYEKLTKQSTELRQYLMDTCNIPEDQTMDDPDHPGSKINVLDQQVDYWEKMQDDPLVIAALEAALNGANSDDEKKKAFDDYFQFAVAARPGGIRTGDMANNRLTKRINPTGTANSYYLPSVSDNSSIDNGVILNNYLGNNGILEIANAKLLVTKMLQPMPGMELPKKGSDDKRNLDEEEFLYQLYVQGLTGEQEATLTFYNPYGKSWQRQVASVDVLTDNHDLLQTTGNDKALFYYDEDTKTAQHVVLDGGVYCYANEDGTSTGEPCGKEREMLYYLYLPSNAEGGSHTRTLYETNENGDRITDNDHNWLAIYYSDDPGKPDEEEENTNYLPANEENGRPAGTFAYYATDAELIPVGEVDKADAAGGDGWQYGIPDKDGYKDLPYYSLVVTKPEPNTSENDVYSPFKTRSLYVTKTLVFGQNANNPVFVVGDDGKSKPSDISDGGPNANGKPLTEDDLYDGIVPTVDRPDLFNAEKENATAAQIAAHTAEFTLRNGRGLLLTGLRNRITYRYTEKLTQQQMDEGYTLKELDHVQQLGSQTVYKPGKQEIPVYTGAGAFNSDLYPAQYRSARTENDLTWALDRTGKQNDRATVSYEPFNHANAVIWEYYATMRGESENKALSAVGNHHHPEDAGDESSNFFLWKGRPGEYEETNVADPVDPNPSCKDLTPDNPEAVGCDKTQADGTIRHYMYYKGVLVDPHYEGEASAYLRNMARFGVSTTAHFGVKNEAQPSPVPPAQASTDYTGVYSSFGNTGYFEEQSHFVNTVVPQALSITKTVRSHEDSELSEDDLSKTSFEFTLNLYEGAGMADGEPTGAPLTNAFAYVITKYNETTGEEEIAHYGCLLSKDRQGVVGYTAPEEAPSDLKQENIDFDEKINGWRFSLKNGETITVSGVKAPYAYTVTETENGLFTSNPGSVSKAVTADGTGTVKLSQETFINEKKPPKPDEVSLLLTKTLIDPCGQYDWRANPFVFLVVPGAKNPEGDPVPALPGWDDALGALVLSTASNGMTGAGQATLAIFEDLPFTRKGTFTYTVTEQASGQGDVRCDRTQYDVTVLVTLEKAEGTPGELHAKLTVKIHNGESLETPDGETPTLPFVNHCDRKPELPLTGDDSPIGRWIALLTLSGLAMRALAGTKAQRGASR